MEHTNAEIRRKILERVVKLSNMVSPDANAFQGEINNAAAKIQELMDKYSISAEDVEAAKSGADSKQDEAFTEGSGCKIDGIKPWHWVLANAIARVTHTRHYALTNRTTAWMKFFGRGGNSEVASSLFSEWSQVIEAMAESATDDYWKVVMKKYHYADFLKQKKLGLTHGKFMDSVPYGERTTYYKRSWLDGCVDQIMQAVREQEKTRTDETSTALVIYDEKLTEAYNDFSKNFRSAKSAVRKTRGYSEVGYGAGREAGSTINIGIAGVRKATKRLTE